MADVEELKSLDASEIHARRLSAKEVLEPKKTEEFFFWCADVTSQVGRRRSRNPNIHLNSGLTRSKGQIRHWIYCRKVAAILLQSGLDEKW